MPTRLLPHRASHRITLLHAPTPPDMLPTLQYLLPTRCARWIRRTLFQPVDKIRRRPRHGHRPMHHIVPARVLVVGLPTMGDRFPGAHLPGFREPLYPHVCDSSHGGLGGKPQERGQVAKLAPQPLLYQ